MRLAVLCALSLASRCSALKLAGRHTPFMPRVTMSVRMQQPASDAAEAGGMTPEAAEMVGSVVPTKKAYVIETPEQTAYKEQLFEKGDQSLRDGFRRAAFWTNETASLIDLLNVLGRFDKCEQFRVRTEFSVPESTRTDEAAQGETYKRHEMALRMGCAERVALYQIAPTLPFKNEALAASVGLTVEDFEALEVSKAACDIVYDAMAESASGLIPYDVIDSRRAKLLGPNNDQFDASAFTNGLVKSRFIFIFGLFFLGKGNFLWILVGAKLLHDWKPDVVPSPVDLGLFKIWGII